MSMSYQSIGEQMLSLNQEKKDLHNRNINKNTLNYLFAHLKNAINHSRDEKFGDVIAQCIQRLKVQLNGNQGTSQIQQFINKEILLNFKKGKKKILMFLLQMMKNLPSLTYKIIQKNTDVLRWEEQNQLDLFKLFIEHAKQKRNIYLIESQIKKQLEINSTLVKKFQSLCQSNSFRLAPKQRKRIEEKQIDYNVNPQVKEKQIIIKKITHSQKRLEVLLNSSNLDFLPQETVKEIISVIDKYKSEEIHIWKLKLIKLLMGIKWVPGQILQFQKIIEYVEPQIQKNVGYIEDIVNDILIKIEVREAIIPKLQEFLKTKIKMFLKVETNMQNKMFMFNLMKPNEQKMFKFIEILFAKLEKGIIQKAIPRFQYEEFLDSAISSSLNSNVVDFLKIAKKKQIHSEQLKMQEKLLKRIEQMLNPKANIKKANSLSNKPSKISDNNQNQNEYINSVTAIRNFQFDTLNPAFMIVKKGVLKNPLIEKQKCKIQAIKTCLHMTLKFQSSYQSMCLMKQVLRLTGNDPDLKKKMIKWLKQNSILEDSHLYDIYKNSEYLGILFHDYSSNQIDIRKYSIKVLCIVYPFNQCEIVPFLKKNYYQLHDRLSRDLADDKEKQQNLNLIRQIIKFRTEIIKQDADNFAKFLRQQLQKQVFGEYISEKLIEQILKTFSSMVQMLPSSSIKHVRHVAGCLIHILQRKDLKIDIKNESLIAFNQIIMNMGYVLIPYFHFRSLLPTINQLLKNDQMRSKKSQFLKFLGGLGYMSRKKYQWMAIANKQDNNIKQVENCFRTIFGDINYLKERDRKEIMPQEEKKQIKTQEPFRKQLKLGNYKSYTIERIFHILGSNASQSMKSKCYEVLERLIYILMDTQGPQQQMCLHRIILPQIIKITDKKYSDKILSFLAVITTHKKIDQTSLYNTLFFLLHYDHNQIVYQTIYTITQKLNFQKQKDKIVNEIINWLIKIGKKQKGINDKMIIITFAIIENVSAHLDLFLHLFFPDYISAFMVTDSIPVCEAFLNFFLSLARSNSLQQFLPIVTAKLNKLIKPKDDATKKNASFIHKLVTFFVGLLIRFGDNLKGSVSNFDSIITQLTIKHVFYDIALDYMKYNNSLSNLKQSFKYNQVNQIFMPYISQKDQIATSLFNFTKIWKKIQQIEQLDSNSAFEAFIWQSNAIEQESDEWFNRLAISLFRASNDLFLRNFSLLAQQDSSICLDMFPLGLYFFYISIQPSQQLKIFPKLEKILETTSMSLRIKQKLLDTLFFLKQCNPQIVVKDKLMFKWSKQVWDNSKALFYKQNLYQSSPETHGQELINMYLQLDQQESAEGLLKKKKVKIQNSKNGMELYLKFGKFQQAKNIFQNIATMSQKTKAFQKLNIQILIKKDRLDWENASKSCQAQKKNQNTDDLGNIALIATQAAINMGQWDRANYWIKKIPKQDDNYNIWQAMLKVNQKKYEDAKQFIQQDRANYYPKICQLNNFSVQRYIEGILRVQQLCQLQQIIEFKKFEANAKENEKKRTGIVQEKKRKLIKLWKDRTQGFIDSLEHLQKILLVRSLLLDVKQNASSWVNLCHLALQKKNGVIFCQRIVKKYLNKNQSENYRPQQNELFDFKALKIQTEYRKDPDDIKMIGEIKQLIKQKQFIKMKEKVSVLLYQCAKWLTDSKNKNTDDLLEILEKSVNQDINNYKAWRLMALVHMQIIEQLKDKKNNPGKQTSKYQHHTFQALKCFISSVSVTTENHQYFMQNCLKILNIIFSQTNVPNLVQHLTKNIIKIPSQGLILIIPQIVGRLQVPQQSLLDIMTKLIVHIASNHPQAFLFPLIFLKRNTLRSKNIGIKIQNLIKEQQNKRQGRRIHKMQQLEQQAQIIVQQLCKVSLKLSEKFKIAMSTQKLDQKKNSIDAIAKMILKTCQSILDQAQSELSLSEFGFIQRFRLELKEICNYLKFFLETKQKQFYQKALKIVSKIKERISSIDNIYKINLTEASPQLLAKKKSIVCIPGTYKPNQPNVYISGFKQVLQVIKSKQRPKKMVIQGSDGKQYNFLLKGKEDLRLDERIMQLVSLVNTMFDDPVQKQLYLIQGYSITPLSPQAGLIGWVQNCDTIADLIINYRKQYVVTDRTQFIQINISRQKCQYYDNLSKYHKVQIFRQIQSMISGQDLKNIFWLKANNTEEWLRFRSCYTRSLAVMSMVGFIIGLGDRHLKNILLQRMTGRIVHIDFGDCFDKNRMREDFPERVPFRLTRMLVKAMEPFGVEGIFTHTCQKILEQLRKNSLIIMAIIEAFRYDPIIGWKLAKKDNIAMESQHVEYEQHLLTQESRIQDDQNQSMGMKKPQNPFEKQRQFALHIEKEIKLKLEGKTNKDAIGLDVKKHTEKLINQARCPQNLVEHYILWNIHW